MKKFLKILKYIFLILLLLVLILSGIVIYKGYSVYKEAISEISVQDKISNIRSNTNFLTIDNLPKDFLNAVIAIEDNRFYSHSAIDFRSIGRAIYVNISNFELLEGGSTITQQLSKNIFFTQRKEATRKIAEIFLAFDLEKTLNKDEILELYVNTNYYGDGYYGIKEAANGYFKKEPIDMNLYECTLLAGVPNAPSVYAPTINPDLASERQIQVINAMVKYDYLTDSQKEDLLNQIEEKQNERNDNE